ncbi:hypothetical protein NUW58_g3482 [Xylaria curta]|uniref:Uncharacterized protein n=1 Tax=Xylaria curta TaxID=42375 RepID=A0ACC1PC94_9PEZI|nr:hypothetical protein NUW58_g3482 [Xylaria curta]
MFLDWLNWDDRVRSTAWQFGRYRSFERLPDDISNNLNVATPDNAGPRYRRAKRKLAEARHYFSTAPNFEFVGGLGFGGMSLAIKYRLFGRGFVVKISLDHWQRSELRHEEEQLRKMDKARHIIQKFSDPLLRMPRKRPFEFERINLDDSSEEEESSGDESRDEWPDPDVLDRRTRRERIAAAPQEWAYKRQRHRARVLRRRVEIRNRHLELERRYRAGQRWNQPGPDPYDGSRRDYLLVEEAQRGDLRQLLCRVNAAGGRIPNRVLWGFWLCMVRACVAMEYPPRKFHPRRREPPTDPANARGPTSLNSNHLGKKIGGELFEDLPPARQRWASKRHVHFDIDPQNILIDQCDFGAVDDEHRMIPALKLNDFGLATEVKPRKRNVYYMNLRMRGKYGYYAPEQFAVDWDYVKSHTDQNALFTEDGPEVSEQLIAGNYGPATNVWGFALVSSPDLRLRFVEFRETF